jgi:hypothetical protein
MGRSVDGECLTPVLLRDDDDGRALPITGMGWASDVSGGMPNWLWLLTALLVVISILSTIYLLRQVKEVW